jgi:hypothetical protein
VFSSQKIPSRISSRIQTTNNDCWEWTGAIHALGYGIVSVNGISVLVHRFIWEQVVGELRPHEQLCHGCDNRLCCNPSHLEPYRESSAPQTYRANSVAASRKFFASRTHCKHGHSYAEVGIRWYRKDGYWCRGCRGCERDRVIASRKYAVSPRERAMSFLSDCLASGEWSKIPSHDFNHSTFTRAKQAIGVESKPGGTGAGKGGTLYRLAHH